jgi:hypothetical protein
LPNQILLAATATPVGPTGVATRRVTCAVAGSISTMAAPWPL